LAKHFPLHSSPDQAPLSEKANALARQKIKNILNFLEKSWDDIKKKFWIILQKLGILKKTLFQKSLTTASFISQKFTRIKTSFRSFPILIKLNLILTGIVLIVVVTFSMFVLQYGKQILRKHLDELCVVNMKSLSKSISGHLLVNKIAPISEAVFLMQKAGISGLKSIRVVDRSGKIVVSLPLATHIDSMLIPAKFDSIKAIRDWEIFESELYYEYYSPIVIKNIQEDVQIGTLEFRFSKKQVLKPIAQAQRLIILFAVIIILLSIIGIYFLSQKMTLQIKLLSEGAKQIARGNLNIRIPKKSNDELGRLVQEFNSMVIGLREKLEMQKFVSKATVRMIKEHSNATELPRESQKRSISVLFSDVRNFSLVAENNPPEEVVKLINIYLDLQAEIIEQNNGIVDKFIGDQVMGVFEGEHHEKDALATAVGIQKAISGLNRKRRQEKKQILEVGIGLSNGDAVLGNIGSRDRKDCTVIGSIVNLGSHLCAKAKPKQIIATYDFIAQVNGILPIKKLEPIQLKGRNRPVNVFEIAYNRE